MLAETLRVFTKKVELKNKTILLISPSNWGDIHISKHHYSIELTKLGNEVYYLEPAVSINPKGMSIKTPISELPNLKVVTIFLPRFIEIIRFKFRKLYNLIIPIYIKRINKIIDGKFDIVWCFETNLYSNLRKFNANFAIFHPVDLLVYKFQSKIAKSADIVFYVSETIHNSLKGYHDKLYFINHGLSSEFETQAIQNLQKLQNEEIKSNSNLKIGFIGNLLRKEVNYSFFKEIINANEKLDFYFWGPYKNEMSNIEATNDEETHNFITFLQSKKNVFLKGVKPPSILSKEITVIDIFLLSIKKSKTFDGSNSHKILEYLSTGKVIVTSRVDVYDNSNLLEMAISEDNLELVTLFNNVVSDFNKNTMEKQIKRIQFALNNTYKKQLKKIINKLNL